MPRFTYTHPNHSEEQVEYFMDGELIISSDYDQHGYSGMEAIEKTIKAIARKLGTSLKEIEPEDQ